MSGGVRVEFAVHFERGGRGRKSLAAGARPGTPPVLAGRVPRVSRLMAMAIRFDGLVRRGEVRDFADLARLGHVSRARISQIHGFLALSPRLQEALLFLPVTTSGADVVSERDVRLLATVCDWVRQHAMWDELNLDHAAAAMGSASRGAEPVESPHVLKNM